MSATAEKSDPKLWDKVKKQVTKSDKGGKPGQWSARKAQMATTEYKKEGGGYEGSKKGNHLKQWTKEEWGTKSGEESGKTGERYLPKKARDGLSKEEYDRTTEKKQADTRKGKQHSAQPKDVARKTAAKRDTGRSHAGKGDLDGLTRDELMKRAAERNVSGRSRMRKAELVKALSAKTH
ncbi:hypothetical protein [Rhizosaccharibacter radicis]|uniref:DUF5872 domain-containing protein n=1 Tax=Rhizosaccharibacter radicis TaxID=2782605 RepID=A0ABT1VVG6_9PROT|nr:hypothetical protein [Acetobacteraceae bacterium KSS12]